MAMPFLLFLKLPFRMRQESVLPGWRLRNFRSLTCSQPRIFPQ